MKRIFVIVLVVVLVAIAGAVTAETSRKEFANNIGSFCLNMATVYMDAYEKSPCDEYLICAYYYYFMYCESKSLNRIEGAIEVGVGAYDVKVIESAFDDSVFNDSLRDEYKNWIKGEGNEKILSVYLKVAIKAANKVSEGSE